MSKGDQHYCGPAQKRQHVLTTCERKGVIIRRDIVDLRKNGYLPYYYLAENRTSYHI